MNCNECLDNLVAYLEGMLEPAEAQRLRAHLKFCEVCRAECAAFAQLQQRLIRWAQAGGSPKNIQKL